jgi:NAD(P)-dependent dehydrogenase (short-subunit alcohol dehydrogenase family)
VNSAARSTAAANEEKLMSQWSLGGKTCFVTGATSGIGEETALAMARAGARVGILARNRERALQTRERIAREVGGEPITVIHGDLASLQSVRGAAEEILERFDALHLLINNAGLIHFRRTNTEDGFESTFAVNHLGPFLLTNLLLDRIIASAPGRIVNVASDAHRFARRGLDLSDLQNERSYGAFRTYGQSKLANILFTLELAERLKGTGVTANALHPGAVATRLGNNNGLLAKIALPVLKPFFRTPAQGAETSIYLATDPELADISGGYFANCKKTTPSAHAQNEELASALWKQSCALVGLPV